MKNFKILTYFIFLLSSTFYGQTNNSAVKIHVINKKTKAPIVDSLYISLDNNIMTNYRVMTNNDGDIMLKQLEPGKYDISVTVKGYLTHQIKQVIIGEAKTAYLFFNLESVEDLKYKKHKRIKK